MSKKPDLVPFEDARKRAGDDLLPYARLDSWIKNELVYSPDHRAVDGQRLVDWNDVKSLLNDVKEAIRIGRLSTAPFSEKDGTRWLPLFGDEGVLKRDNGFKFERETVQGWHSQRDCPCLGRRVGKTFFARTPTGKWRWVLFVKESDIVAIETAAKNPQPAKPRVGAEDPGSDWPDTEETMRITGASRLKLIQSRTIVGDRRPPGERKKKRGEKSGFAVGADRLPLHAKVFDVEQVIRIKKGKRKGQTITRVVPEVRYYRPHAEEIGKRKKGADWRFKLRPDDIYIDPENRVDERGKEKRYFYASGVKKRYRWRDTTLSKWRVYCPALGRAIKFLEVESRYPNRENEFVYLEADLEAIKGEIGGTNWKRNSKGKLADWPRGEGGLLLRFPGVDPEGNGRSKPRANGNGETFATAEATESTRPTDAIQSPRPRIVLRGKSEAAIVNGKEKPLRPSGYAVVKALIDAGDDGLSKDQLFRRSGKGDAWGILKRLRNDPDWAEVLVMPGEIGGRYRAKT